MLERFTRKPGSPDNRTDPDLSAGEAVPHANGSNGAAGAAGSAPGDGADGSALEPVTGPPARVLLVRGCPRSGTTMLAELVNSSPHAGIIFEYALGQLARDLAPVMAYGRDHRSLRSLLGGASAAAAANDGVYYNEPKVGPLIRFPAQERFHAILRSVVEASLAKRDLAVIGSKTPGALALTDRDALEPFFPRISYLFTVRNPLHTVNSMLNRRNLARLGVDDWPWADAAESIEEYRQNVRLLLSHVAAYPDDVFVVKYEDLVGNLDATADRVGEFLGVAFDYGELSPLHENGYLRRQPAATKLVLTPQERADVEAAFGPAIAAWDDKVLTGPGASVVDALTDCLDPMRVDTKYRYGAGTQRHFLGLGWSTLQDDGVWSDAKRADLIFPVESDGDYVLYAEASFYVPDARPALNVAVDVNGDEAFRGTFIASSAQQLDASAGPARVYPGEGRKGLLCGPLRLSASGVNRLTFTIDDPRSPFELGISADARKVAVMLHSVLLTKA